jgi:hypothetical protein
MVFHDGGRVIASIINLLNDQIDESQHDIESIETYVAKQDETSISTEQSSFIARGSGHVPPTNRQPSDRDLRAQVTIRDLCARAVGTMKLRDAIICFQCLPNDMLQVIETVDGSDLRHEQVMRDSDVVTEMEKKYMFFAEQAAIARKQIKRGQSCVFNVYYREP